MRPSSTSRAAFSLVELSIVLVILGLLVGGILAGQSLIRAAELRSISTEQQRFITAISAFRDKYFALPGDFNRASGAGNFAWTDSAGTAAGNGNADGMVVGNATAASNETSTFWVHLAAAGLVEGTYTQVGNATALTSGTHIPRSRLGNAGWKVQWVGGQLAASTDYFPGSYGNSYFFGASGTVIGTQTGIISPEEAWNVDTKMDDGRPDQGNILIPETQHTAAATAGRCAFTSASVIQYQLADTSGTACSLISKSGY